MTASLPAPQLAGTATDLTGLDDNRWSKALKLAATHTPTPPPAVSAELRRRTPPPQDLVVLLGVPAGWADLRAEVFAGAAAAPELGPSALSVYLQPVGRTVHYADRQAGPPHEPVFAARVIDGDLV